MTSEFQVALVHGAGCSIGSELAALLAAQGLRVLLYDVPKREQACLETARSLSSNGFQVEVLPALLLNVEAVEQAVKTQGRLDFLFNCLTLDANSLPSDVFEYPKQLLERNLAAAEAMAACASAGAIVNQCFLGSLFQDTPFESAMLMARGSITGVTREICCRFGKAGIRTNTIQLGLFDLAETAALLNEKTRARKTPVGRWGTPAEAAKFMLFLALRNGYMTGQSICFDGGLTSGNTGT